MMKIESVEVIPMRKDSMFEETPLNTFECSMITTSYDQWKSTIEDYVKRESEYDKIRKLPEYDSVCERFAKVQKAFMTAPTAIFHDSVYLARAVRLPSEDHLFAMSNTGPLYTITKEYIDDTDADRTEERFYTDPSSFQRMHGLWYPYKAVYKLRYGVREKK